MPQLASCCRCCCRDCCCCVCVCVLYVDFWSRFLRPGANVGILAVFVADYLEAHLIWVRALALARLAWLDVY